MGQLVFLVEAGSAELVRALADGGEERLATVGPGGYLGELAPMLQLPRSATAQAEASGATVVGLTPDRFRRRTKDPTPGPAPSATKPKPKPKPKPEPKAASPAAAATTSPRPGRARRSPAG
jgi:hypothetical protein